MGGVKVGRGNAGTMTSDQIAAMVDGATATLRTRLTQAEQAASSAQSAATAAQSTAASAQTTAATAKSTADAAQSTISTTLVPGYTSLTDTANTVQALNAASLADRAQLNSRVAKLEAKTWVTQTATGTTTAAVAIGGIIDVAVTWPTPIPDLNYLLVVTPDASGVLLSSMVAIKSRSTTGAVITIKAFVALTAGVKLTVQVGRWG